MRFLKNKIYLSQQLRSRSEKERDFQYNRDSSLLDYSKSTLSLQSGESPPPSEEYYETVKRKNSANPKTPEKIRCTKNIVKNYGRAIAKFACSEMALPYLVPILKGQEIEFSEAMTFFTKAKNKIQGIDTFRELVLIRSNDTPKEIAFKITFQKIGEAFIKYFSVNWIFHSKILHRSTYLKYRFKMLRRLQNPELFTYLKG